jgi:hypothetical protein
MVAMTAPQQFSPDGQWWWDGTQWIPAAQAPQPAPPQQPQANPGGWPPAGDPSATPPPGYQQPAAPPYAQQPFPQQPAYGYPTQPLYGAPQPSSGSDGKGIASLVCSLIPACGVTSIVAVILGHLSRSDAKKKGRQPSGISLAGLIIGYLGIVGWAIVIAVVATHTDEIAEGFDLGVELKSAADAEHSYHDASGTYTADLDALERYGYVNVSGDRNIQVVSATSTTFCLKGTLFGEDQYISEHDRSATSTPCGGER